MRKRLQADILPQVAPSMMRKGEWATSWTQMFLRLFIYSWTAIRWITQSLWDRIRGIDSLERRAQRLREFIELLGGSAVKLGQQMAMRIDMLPYEYTVELSKMLDRMPPFPIDTPSSAWRAFWGCRLGEAFTEFDPIPIGSASVACVFSGVTWRMARGWPSRFGVPASARQFVADCDALGAWSFKALEFLTVHPPGLSHNFLFDFRSC